jgi:acetyl-CoA carboxylase carboxyl transferase subunit beta
MKCSKCNQAVYRAEVEGNLEVCPACNHHFRIDSGRRLGITVDPGSFKETHVGITTVDPLDFKVGETSYRDKVEVARKKTGLPEALVTGFATVEGQRAVLGFMDSTFIMASMGSAVGEKFCLATEDAIRERVPFVVFAASGGARMQEGILSLMQMAKTASAVRAMQDAGVPYIVVLTDPTTGGVYASFASLGDITLAEPGAYIGFAGARLIEGALKVKLPEGFQRTEYQYENGFVDSIVQRSELRPMLGRLLLYLQPQ